MKSTIPLCLAALMSVVFVETASSQEQSPPVPIELWACNFKDGRGMAELQAANERLNHWADQNGITALSSSMLTPLFHSPDNAYDVLFIDRWSSGEALGAGYAQQVESPQFDEVERAYNDAIECPSHAYFAGLLVVPPSTERGADGPIQFQDCTASEGKSNADVLAAIRAFSDGAGPRLGGFAIYLPFMGQPLDAAYDFKFVALFDSYRTMGSAFDTLFRGQGFEVASTTIASVMQCDSARMYMQTSVRRMQDSE